MNVIHVACLQMSYDCKLNDLLCRWYMNVLASVATLMAPTGGVKTYKDANRRQDLVNPVTNPVLRNRRGVF
jgi:hypothetical protein